jgi:hypothetical protein
MKFVKIIKAYLIFFITGWNTLDLTPPNRRVMVKDMNGNIAFAYPTYYPFEIKKLDGDDRKPYGWRGTPIFYENNIEKWDGGWMILYKGLTSTINSEVKYWRNLKK